MSSKKIITRDDIKFWVFLVGLVVGVVIWETRLEGRVNAITDREQLNKDQFIKISQTVEEINDTVIRIDTNQGHIMSELGIKSNKLTNN